MELKTLIFSNRLRHRILRHIFFWVAWFCVIIVSSSPGVKDVEGLRKIIQFDSMIAIQHILLQALFGYFILYFLIPTFFIRKKYALGITILIGSIIGIYWLDATIFRWTSPYVSAVLGDEGLSADTHNRMAFLFIGYYFGALACCSMLSLKFLKIWYIRHEENTELKRENIIAELQLLKAQVHPHFLFNTLNNIYSFTLMKSPIAADLLEKLSGMLSYMIREGQHTWVPLRKEIQLIQDYISLEKVRYGARLDIKVNIKGNVENKLIAPLLMIPFVENSFKHGSSKMLSDPKVELSIVIEEPLLMFTLTNNKPGTNVRQSQCNSNGGIGLRNTAKRLQLLYPEKHELKIESTDTTFSVKMNIVLKEAEETNPETPARPLTRQMLSYANT